MSKDGPTDDNSGRSTEDWIFRMYTTLLLQKASFHWQTKLEKQKLSRVSTPMRTNHNHKHYCVTAFIVGSRKPYDIFGKSWFDTTILTTPPPTL